MTVASTKDVILSVFPNKIVWFIGVDVEFVLSCRSDPLGRHGDKSKQEALAPVSSLETEEDDHERQYHDISVEVCSHGGNKHEYGVLVHEQRR